MQLVDDIKPIYLGYEVKTRKYYFYVLKAGVPRFIEYYNYFFFGVGPATALTLAPIPEQVELDLEAFLEGKLEYEFRKKRINSRGTSVFKVYRMPQEVHGNGSAKIGEGLEEAGSISGATGSAGGGHADALPRRRARRSVRPTASNEGKLPGIPPDVQHGHPPCGGVPGPDVTKPKRIRRTKAQMAEARKLEEATALAVVDVVKEKETLSDKQPTKTAAKRATATRTARSV